MSRRRAASPAKRLHPTYDAYIRSDAWRCSPARLAELLASGGRCRLCNEGRPAVMLTVHHRTYERLGREETDDLTTLCEPCHDVVTDMLRDRSTSDRPLPVALDLPRHPRTLVDSVEKGRR